MRDFATVAIPVGGASWFVLTSGRLTDAFSRCAESKDLPTEWRGERGDGCRVYENGDLRLFEGLRYSFLIQERVPGAHRATVNSSLERGADWWVECIRSTTIGGFRVVNFLGSASITVNATRIDLEISSRKLDFDTEYRAMVSRIAEECQQLLLDWDTPTSAPFVPDPGHERRTLLEAFLFLRQALDGPRIQLYSELLQRRPDVRLQRESRYARSGMPDFSLLMAAPDVGGRSWYRTRSGNVRPSEILHTTKQEVFDTAANRFVRFALEEFFDITRRVREAFDSQSLVYREALSVGRDIQSFLRIPALQGLQRLARVPVENQVLQKRDGYRDLLKAWLLVSLAAQLHWPGHDDAYSGSSRNVATLYEYWCLLVVRKVLIAIGFREVRAAGTPTADALVTVDKAGLRVNLKQGVASLALFRCDRRRLWVHLYYNRTFHALQRGDTRRDGSYSRQFRPDISLAVIPLDQADSVEERETRAAETDRAAWLHFDAKYRVEHLTELFGVEPDDGDKEVTAAEIESEHGAATYKRGDLLKMHTYKDAIRRTTGSFVLYPGTDGFPMLFQQFHEILPGVGAFVLKPTYDVRSGDSRAYGYDQLCTFLDEFLAYHGRQFASCTPG